MIGGRYEIKHVIGRGGMGEVLLAEDTILGRPVAIKHLVTTEHGEDPATAGKRLLREAKSAARIHHPNVVAIHDLVVEGDDTYIVMEYVPAKNLEQVMLARPLSVEDAAHIGAQVAAALGAAHQLGIVHRDVKPSNILVDEHRVAKLADFGVARSVGDAVLTQTGLVIGSVAYMPPEVAKGFEATSASDIYSLGATVFAAIEGHAPFAENPETSTPIAVLARLVTSPAPVPERAGRLTDVIAAMLSADPADRPGAAEVSVQLARIARPSLSPAPASSAELVSSLNPVRPADSYIASPTALDSSPSRRDDTDLRTHVRQAPPASGGLAQDEDELLAPTIIRTRADTNGQLSREGSTPNAPTEAPRNRIINPIGPGVHEVHRPEPDAGAGSQDARPQEKSAPTRMTDGPTSRSSRVEATSKSVVGDEPTVIRETSPVVMAEQRETESRDSSGSSTRTSPTIQTAPRFWGTPRRRWIAIAAVVTLSAALVIAGALFKKAPGQTTPAVVATIAVGESPGGVALNSKERRAYVATCSGALSIIDVDSRTAIDSIPVGGDCPELVALDTDDPSLVYVTTTHNGNASLVALDTKGNTKPDSIELNQMVPTGIAVDSKVYVASPVPSEDISVTDPKTHKALAISLVGKSPCGVAIDGSGSRLYVAGGTESGAVSAVDLMTHKVVESIPVGKSPCGISVGVHVASPAIGEATGFLSEFLGGLPSETLPTDLLYVTNRDDGTLSIIDVGSFSVIATVPVGNRPTDVAVDSELARVYVVNSGDGTVSMIDTTTNQVAATIRVGSEPKEVAVDGVSHDVYITNSGENTISVIAG